MSVYNVKVLAKTNLHRTAYAFLKIFFQLMNLASWDTIAVFP